MKILMKNALAGLLASVMTATLIAIAPVSNLNASATTQDELVLVIDTSLWAGAGDVIYELNFSETYIVRTVNLSDINRIRVTVGGSELVQVRYNN